MKKFNVLTAFVFCFVGCASNPPENNDAARSRAHAAYSEANNEFSDEDGAAQGSFESQGGGAPTIVSVSNTAFKSRPTVLVTPAMGRGETPNIEVVRKNPLARTAMEVINSYMTGRDYNVIGLESQAQLDEVVQLQADIAGNDEDLAYVAGLSVGADINISFSGSVQVEDLVIDLCATEASTANMLASVSVRYKNEGESQRAWVQKAVQDAIVKLENKIRDRLAATMENGNQYKVIAHLTGKFTDGQAEEISNMVSSQIRKKFNKMQVISMSRNTFDLLVFADPSVYDDAQMVYDEFVVGLNGLAKVRKQNITKKLIIMEIQ